jgi:hypothetical protein
MDGSRVPWRRLRARLVGGLVAPCLFAVTGTAAEQPSLPPAPAETVPAPALAPAPLDLAACKALAEEKQPIIAAARATLAAAIARQQALEQLCVPTFLQRDLPTRRKQAALGVTAAQASVTSAEIDTRYAVQFAYLTYQYAHVQKVLGDDVRVQLEKLRVSGRPKEYLGRIDALLSLAKGRQQEAILGLDRAKSLLAEAVGLDDCPQLVLLPALPEAGATVDLHQAVDLALARRPEIVQATIGTEVSGLEICAQRSRRFSLSTWTFAAGSDLHANPLPTSSFNPGYRPGAIGMEMPVTLNGKRCNRVEQAEIYNGRALSVLEKTQRLIRLETEQAYLRYVEAREKLAEFRRGVKQARAALDATAPPTTTLALGSYLGTATLLTDLRLEMNRARYEMLVGLIALERATAGGVCAGLENAPPAADYTREESRK